MARGRKRTYTEKEELLLWENRGRLYDGTRQRLAQQLGRSLVCISVKLGRMYREVNCGLRNSDGRLIVHTS